MVSWGVWVRAARVVPASTNELGAADNSSTDLLALGISPWAERQLLAIVNAPIPSRWEIGPIAVFFNVTPQT